MSVCHADVENAGESLDVAYSAKIDGSVVILAGKADSGTRVGKLNGGLLGPGLVEIRLVLDGHSVVCQSQSSACT